jgi:hypothetical protein
MEGWSRVDGRNEQRRESRKAEKRGNKCARKTIVRCRKGERRCREEEDGAEKERLLDRDRETLMQRREEAGVEKY